MKIPGKLALGTIQKKLPTLTTDQLAQLNDSISLAPDAVVAVDTKRIASPIVEKTFSMRLKKWVEPYTIAGVDYSLFYTEVDHNFKVGDRIFIEGGVYDSDAYIKKNKYKKNVDGYKVLYVDRCKVVLDIKYTGDFPTNEEPIDNFVKVYVANTQDDFDYFSQTLSMRNDSGIIQNKFDLGFNNFLYLNGTFSITPGSYNLTSFAQNFALTSTSPTLGNSFVIRGATGSPLNTYFVDITNDVFSNSFTSYLNSGWTQSFSGFFNNGKLRVMNGNFIKNDVSFKNEYIYYYDTIDNIWKIDKSYLPTIITEQHFKRGNLKKGTYNQGLYGQHEERIKYRGDEITWNLGSTLNVDWESGVLDSTIFKDDSSFTIFDRFNLPQIRANAANNGGAGYNYIFNTNFTGGDVINGNIFNMAVVLGTNSATQSVLENYLLGQQTMTYSINLKGGVYYNSDILFASVSNSTLISSYVYNSMLNKVKSVNSEIENSVFLNGTWISDKVVKIQSYEESNIVWYDENSNQIPYKMYKFYVNDTNWVRLREFQNFYFQDLGINISSTELLNFFDDKFSIGQYYRSLDTIGGKFTQRVLIQLSTKEENRNSPGVISSGGTVSMTLNDNALPSIDIFIEGGDDFVYGTSSSYPRPFIADTIDITNSYILDSDFVSGLFKDSRWVSGNYFNYNADYSLISNDGYLSSYDTLTKELALKSYYQDFRRDILGTNSTVQNITWVNGLYYDSSLNGGINIVKLSDTYKINNVATFSNIIPYSNFGRDFYLQDLYTQSGNNVLPTFISQQYIKTIGSQNRWNYLHPVKFENSVVSSGIFRRAYFENCEFVNSEFDSTDRELSNVSNKRKLLLSDIIFSDNSNKINSGLVQYSHFVAGSDNWENGIFHRGVWNTKSFTYSFVATPSNVYYVSGGNTFKNGIFRNSTWVDGTFENGLFYKNDTNAGGTASTFLDTLQVYYIDNLTTPLTTRWSWQDGIFNNGDFEKSNFEKGSFLNGNFYDSNFLTGEATGGNFGKTNIDYSKTRVWTGTFSNVNVVNAEFRTQDPIGGPINSSIFAPQYYINWISGVFNKGVFGVRMIGQYVLCYPYFAIWKDGIFNGGDFTDSAVWENGTFNNGRFTSRYFLFDTFGSFLSPYQFKNSNTPNSWAWQGGKFNGGEFGTGELGLTNSTWYTGEFNGGKFKGKYWKDGIFTRGQFEGSATYSTDASNYIDFYKSFNKYFYGYWENGYVSKNKDKFVKDEKIWTELERTSTYKRKKSDSSFNNMFWNAGTFSNFDAEMSNSFWLNGTFEDGYFNKSVFNPYLNLYKLPNVIFTKTNLGLDFFLISSTQSFLRSADNYYYSFVGIGSNQFYQSDILQLNETYKVFFDVRTNAGISISVNGTSLFASGYTGAVNYTFVATSNDLVVNFTGSGAIEYTKLNVILGTQSGFRITDSCIWKNGEAYSSDFYFSKWEQGVFDSFANSTQGNMWGVIWKDGIAKYLNAYNVYWEGGTWKNGNWNGSPFNQVTFYNKLNQVQRGFPSDIMSNIYIYASQSFTNDPNSLVSIHNNYDLLHINDTFTASPAEYTSIYNNDDVGGYLNLYSMISNIGDPVFLPGDTLYSNNSIKTRFGNGQFLTGVWENGVWNEGWRDDLTLIWSDDLNVFNGGKSYAYKDNVWTWKFQLNILDISNTIPDSSGPNLSSITLYKRGDKVSIGNLVAIDINGNRRTYRGYYEIIDIITNNGQITMELSMNINFPITSIQKDSDEHLIYITKNNWLNGIFLNGYFGSGVWNNGLFRGLPYTTLMENSHWIDGTFKGGHFKGLTSSYYDTIKGLTLSVHNSVIQKFDFYDENLSGAPSQFKYNSWIDVNYYKTEGVNINRVNNVYKTTSLGFTASFVENNFYGYPTKDVLESTSTLRNGFDLNSRTYRLGWKWKEYTDYLIDVGQFIDINEFTYTNFNSTTSGFGIGNFLNDGWTFTYSTQQEGFGYATNSIISNIGSYDSEWLYISGGRRSPQNLFNPSDNSNFTVDIFDNTNITIDKLRYSFIEIEAETLNFTQSISGVVQPVVFYNNYPATYSIAAVNTLFNGSNVTIPINQIATQSVVGQREYFFNKTNLEMLIFSGPTYSLRFKNFRFVETDMIPFTQIVDDCIQFKTNALWNTTPPVTYPTTSNPAPFTYPYPGQWELALPEGQTSVFGQIGNLQLIPDAGLPTWGNFYLVFGGAGCISYVNEDIQIPLSSKSPDLPTDIDFNYLSSDNIPLLQNPIQQL
jgi:hypothetical protein